MANFEDLGVRAVVRNIGKFLSDVGRMNSAVKGAGQNMQRVGAGAQTAGLQMTKFVTLPLLAVGGIAVKSFADFNQAMTNSLAIMDDVSDEMVAKMETTARDVAKATTFSAQQAAESYFFLASAGLDVASSIAALPAVATFAQAGNFDMALATDLLTDSQSALGLTIRDDVVKNMENMIRVSDVLVKANTLANATVQQFSESLTTDAGAALKSFNIDVEEGVAVLAAFADQGVKGQIAGSGLARILRIMTSAAVNNAEAYEALNIRVFDSSGNLNNLGDIIADVENALGGMSDEQRVAALEALGFSARIQGVILPLLGTSSAIRQYEKDLRSAGGITQEVKEKQLESFSAQMSLLKSEVIDVAISLGKVLAPMLLSILKALRPVLRAMGSLAEGFAGLPKPLQFAIVGFFAFLAALGPILIITGTLLTAMGAFVFLMPQIAVGLAAVGGAFLVVLPFILAFIAVMLIAAGLAPVIIDNWEPVSRFFSKSLPDAFEDAGSAIEGAFDGIGRVLANFAVSAVRLGANIITAVGRGIAGAAKGLFRIVAQVVAGMITLLNPFNWNVNSTLVETYGMAGEMSAKNMMRMFQNEIRAAARDSTQAVVEGFGVEDAAEEAVEVAEEAGEDAGNAFLSALEDIVTRSMGAVSSALAAPLEAMRGVVQSLAGELQRLAGLPSVESAQEDLKRAQLAVQEAALRPALREAREARDRIRDIDDEVDALVEQREELIRLAQGHTAESDAVDNEIRSLVKEKTALEKAAQKTEDEAEAIQKQIVALNDLAASREAERAVAVARAQIADQTLATDQEILVALGRMEPLIREVTSAIDAQVSDLQTRFIPAWEEAGAAIEGAGGGGAVGAPELGDLGEIDFTAINTALEEALKDIESPLDKLIEDMLDFLRKQGPKLAAIGIAILAGIFFGWNIGLAIAIGAAVGFLILEFQDEILGAFKAIGGFIIDNWAEIITVAAFLTPFGPIVALATDAFGIRSALIEAFNALIGELGGVLGGIFDAIVGVFKDVKEFLIGDPLIGDLIAGILAFFAALPLQLVEALASLVEMVLGVWIGLATAVLEFIGGLISDVVSLFTALPGMILEGITGALGPLLGFFVGLPGMLLGAIGNIAGSFFSLGADIIGGLISGITSIDIGDVVSGLAGELTGAIDDLTGGVAGDIVGGITSLSPFAHGAFEVPGAGAGDRVPALLTPGEMVVPRALADVIRSQVSSFQGLADLVSGRSGGSSALGNFMGGGAAGMRDQLDAMPDRSSVASTVSVSAPISVTIQARSWEEIRRLVHSEVDTALENARQETARAGAELSGGIL